MGKYRPYRYWSKEDLKEKLIALCFVYTRREWLLELTLEAIDDPSWDPVQDYDGCSMVQDETHPSLACFLHDWMWKSGRGGKEADFIFYQTMRLAGIGKRKARTRWLLIRIGWIFYYKWYYIRKRHLNKLTGAMKDALIKLEYKK